MQKLINYETIKNLENKIIELFKDVGFDDIKVEMPIPLGGGGNRVNMVKFSIKARNSRGKEKVFDK